MNYPTSPFDTLGGLLYFPRMLNKIRLNFSGELSDYYLDLLGKGFDGRICAYLGIEYNTVVEKVNAGASDDEVLAWSQEVGIKLNDDHVTIWNDFATKRGWNDSGTPTLEGFKQECGMASRDDIRTFFEFIEVDEKRVK